MPTLTWTGALVDGFLPLVIHMISVSVMDWMSHVEPPTVTVTAELSVLHTKPWGFQTINQRPIHLENLVTYFILVSMNN
jgi:hypothetical protein